MDGTKQVIEMNTTQKSGITKPTFEQIQTMKKFEDFPKGIEMVGLMYDTIDDVKDATLIARCIEVVVEYEHEKYLIQTNQQVPKDSSIVKLDDGSLLGLEMVKYG